MPSIADSSVRAADAWLRRFQAALVGVMAAVAGGVGAVAFFTSFEAIRSYARSSNGITPAHAWAIPLLVDSFIVVATGADLWLGVQTARRAWWEVAWPKALLAGAAMVSFVLNVAHAKAGDWPARGVAAIPPAALVLSVELLVMIVRRAALARTHRLTTRQPGLGAATVVVRGDQPTTRVAASGGRPALEATSSDRQAARPADHPDATSSGGDQPASGLTVNATATSAGQATGGATYRRVRELYLDGVTVAAEIARELGVSASYAQRTLRRVKADLDGPPTTPAEAARTTGTKRADQTPSDQEREQQEMAARSHDHLTLPDDNARQATSRAEPTRDADGRTTTTNPDRHLSLVAPQRDHNRGEAER
jgi:hypothetical protein